MATPPRRGALQIRARGFRDDRIKKESCRERNFTSPRSCPPKPAFGRRRMRGEVGLRSNPGEGESPHSLSSEFAEAAPHSNPLRASFARLDPAKSGARESDVSPRLTSPVA